VPQVVRARAGSGPGRASPRARLWLAAGLVAGAAALAGVLVGLLPAGAQESERARRPPPLPRFDGPTLAGGVASTDVLRGRRALVYVWSSTDANAEATAAVVARVLADARRSNVALLGVTRDLEPVSARGFARRHGFDFPTILDRDGAITRRLKLEPGSSAVLVVDGEGNLLGGFAEQSEGVSDAAATYEAYVRELLRLELPSDALSSALGTLPPAPDFRAVSLDGKLVSRADLAGKVAVVVFFLPTCPHCHEMLRFLDRLAARLARDDLVIVPVSAQDRRYLVEDMLRTQKLSLPAYLDPDESAKKAFAHYLGVPDTIVIDRGGRIVGRHTGAEKRTEALVTMEVRQALGVENPFLTAKDSWNGSDACRVCHHDQHATWSLTAHAGAFQTLVEHGADRDPECLPCHTVGWGKPGGYSLETPAGFLEAVGCESCHGRGGPHESKEFLARGFEPVCLECHTEKHSLRFVFAERLPLVSHAAHAQFASLSPAERKALVEKRDRRERTLFEKGRFVGSDACKACHAPQHAIWAQSPHARAFATIAKQGKPDETCVRCHVTGYGEEGGYPGGGEALTNVGCESCHGPGEKHVAEGARRKGTILALSDKCDSCVILQICGSCHDGKWDPDLEFELDAKLAKIRHGMAEAASAP
jgi:peroxiredoxin